MFTLCFPSAAYREHAYNSAIPGTKESYTMPRITNYRANQYCTNIIALLSAGLITFYPTTTRAVEALSTAELISHCVHLESDPEGVDGQYCIRYIQGFIDGAVATDARVMLSAEEELNRGESYTERALRTRAPSHADRFRAAKLAGFCLGDPLPLQEVVATVVGTLTALPEDQAATASAMDMVYASLKKHYPCN